jgi:uncharacterized protein YfiM (DUF2279 family)
MENNYHIFLHAGCETTISSWTKDDNARFKAALERLLAEIE